ncbi:MAG: hypothetical protein LBN24_03830 [Mediterranea sp.]|jgi:hypothetical protein|nr:hypothetical protein [Mediterranea sp.]
MKIKATAFSAIAWNTLFSIALLSLTCCKDDDGPAIPESSTVETPERPTTDALTVTSPLATYVFGEGYTEVPQAIINRLTNRVQSLDGTVSTVILQGAQVGSLSDQQYETLLTIFAKDGNLVVTTPTVSQWNAFAKGLLDAYLRMTSNGTLPPALSDQVEGVLNGIQKGLVGDSKTLYVFDGDEEHDTEHFCDLLALRGNDTYYLDDLNDADDTKQTTYFSFDKDNEGNSDLNSEETEPWKADLNAYDYGVSADKVVEWLNQQPNQGQKDAAMMTRGYALLKSQTRASADLTELMSAQTKYYQFNVYTNDIFSSVASAVVTYDIWAVNDMTNHVDYYLIHQGIDAKNAGLNCGPEGAKYWYERNSGGHKWEAYGGYMTKIESRNSLSGANTGSLELRDHKPGTTVGATQVSTDLSYNIGGEVGLSAEGVSGGVSGGVHFGQSWTTNIPDLSISANSDGSSPYWVYSGPSPKAHGKLYYEHDDAANILQNDCQVHNSWIWRQPDASGTYTLSSDVNVHTEILAYRTKGLWWSGSVYMGLDNKQHFEFVLTPPARVTQRWQMSYSSSMDDNVDQYLESRYADYWKPTLTIYANSNDDTNALEAFFAKFASVLRNDVDIWRKNGHTGDFTFSVKREDNPSIYRTFTLSVGE